MVERLAKKNQCYKTGEGRYNQGKFEEDFWWNAKLKVSRSRLGREHEDLAWNHKITA